MKFHLDEQTIQDLELFKNGTQQNYNYNNKGKYIHQQEAVVVESRVCCFRTAVGCNVDGCRYLVGGRMTSKRQMDAAKYLCSTLDFVALSW